MSPELSAYLEELKTQHIAMPRNSCQVRDAIADASAADQMDGRRMDADPDAHLGGRIAEGENSGSLSLEEEFALVAHNAKAELVGRHHASALDWADSGRRRDLVAALRSALQAMKGMGSRRRVQKSDVEGDGEPQPVRRRGRL